MLQLPNISIEKPRAGIMVIDKDSRYSNTDIYHTLYLPKDWDENKKHPVIVEFASNRAMQFDSSGKVEDVCLGYGLSRGLGYIWIGMPFISFDGTHNQLNWWGDEELTVRYCIDNINKICKEYGGDIDNIFICGFSRGAMAVNNIGLYNDEIADIWKGFISHDHYDGVRDWQGNNWGFPLAKYRAAAIERIKRLKNRPCLIMQNPSTDDIKEYIDGCNIDNENITYLDIPINEMFNEIPNKHFPNAHTGKWILFDNKYSCIARKWINDIAKG